LFLDNYKGIFSFEVIQTLKLIDTIHDMILFYFNGSALTVFLAVGYMRTIPRELTERPLWTAAA